MLQPFRIPLRWTTLVRATTTSFLDHDGLNLAAGLAFYFLLAIFPAVLFVTALASFFPLLPATIRIVTTLSSVAPREVLVIIAQQLLRISEAHHGGLLTAGFLGSLWGGSSALTSTFSILNALYGIHETRSWWRVRLIAAGLTVALGCFFMAASAIVIGLPTLVAWLDPYVALGHGIQVGWAIAKWPVVVVLIAIAIGLVFHFGPDADQAWELITPGAATATMGWLVASVALRTLWGALFARYTATFGTIGGFIALMVWLYVLAIVILLGAEMDAAIERASPRARVRSAGRPVIGRLARERRPRPQGRRRPAAHRAHPPPSPMARHIERHRVTRPVVSEALRPPAGSASRDSSG